MPREPDFQERLYRLLLRAFPRPFLSEYEDDLVQLFRDRRGALAGASRRARALFWIRILGDAAAQSIAERASSRRPRAGARKGGPMIDALKHDTVHAVRSLFRTPGFTLLAASTFALAIGANTAIVSVLHDVLLEPLPFGNPDALVVLWETSASEGVDKRETSAGLFLDWRERNLTMAEVTAWTFDTVALEGREESIALDAVLVYPNFFSVLELDPLFGRRFTFEDAPPAPMDKQGNVSARGRSVILSHALWRDWLGADPAAIGRTLRIDGEPNTVVGVMRPDVAAPDASADLWIPVDFRSPIRWERHNRRLTIYGRLREGADVAAAQVDFSRLASELRASEYADIYEGWDAKVVPLREEIVGGSRPTLFIALAAVGLVLLIACVNIANMLLARGASRQRELGIRTAMGAGRARLAGQLLVESLLLAAMGGALGLAVARLVHSLLLRFQPGILPRVQELSLDPWAFLFAGVLTASAGLLFGLVPALQSTRLDVQRVLREGISRGASAARGLTRARGLLVVAQLGLATVLLCGTGLLLRTLVELGRVDPGFRTENAVALRLFLDTRRYDSEEKVREYYARLSDRFSGLSRVGAAGASSALPMDPLGLGYDLPYRLQGHEELSDNQLPQADFRVVTPGYFEALGVTLRAGRTFDRFDRPETPFVAMVNETMARQVWPRGDAVGQRLETPSTGWNWFEIVGVVSDTRHFGLRTEPRPEVYVAHAQVPRANMTFVVRAKGDESQLGSLLRREVSKQDPSQPTHSLVALADLVEGTVAEEKFYTLVLGTFAALALALSASGVFGVLSYWVAGRTKEIGVRMALGASRRTVLLSVLGRGVGLAFLGGLWGLVAAVLATRAVESVLFQVSATDRPTYAGVALLLLLTALLACALPALRASRVDPIAALREE